MKKLSLLLSLSALSALGVAQTMAYNTALNTVGAAYSQTNTSGIVWGQALNLAAAGKLQFFDFAIYNSSSSAGAMLTGTETINFYDNTTAYTGTGALATGRALLGSLSFSIDFTSGGTTPGGLAASYYSTFSSADLLAANISLTNNVFVTQQYTQLTGTSSRNGIVATAAAPTTGTAPQNGFYEAGTGITEGLYAGTTANYMYYKVQVAPQAVPEPTTVAALGFGALAMLRRRKKA